MRVGFGLSSAVLTVVLGIGCAGAERPEGSTLATAMWDEGPMEVPLGRQVQVWRGGVAGNDVGAVARSIVDSGTRVVFLGETHLDDVTHQVELEMLRQLALWSGGKVVLSMEQFEWDVQPVLDDYLAGRIREPEFLANARPWGNYREAYRPLIEFAKRAGVPVVAGNFPTPLRRKIAGSEDNWAKLTTEERKWVPDQILLHTAEYWARVDRATAAHGPGGAAPSPADRRYSTQALWDNAMAEGVARATDRHPGHVVLHIAGKFHVEYHDGTVSQFLKRRPDVAITTATILPRVDLWRPVSPGDLTRADVVIYAKPTARDSQDGRYGVQIGGELRYRAHLPARATGDAALPLLVWLGSSGCDDAEELRYWQAALGDAAVVLAVEPLHKNREPDLRIGGRWFWDSSYTTDLSLVQSGLERIVEYARRRFPVDSTRIVLAGRGSGATALLWTATYTQSIPGAVVVAQPSNTGKLVMGGRPAAASSTALVWGVTDEDGNPALRGLLEEFSGLGTDTNLTTVPNNSGEVLWELEVTLRRALGLPRVSRAQEGPVVQLRGPSTEPTALRWTALYARRLIAAGVRVDRLVTDGEFEGPVGADDSVLSVRHLAIGLDTDTNTEGEVTMRNAWSVPDLLRRGALPPAPGPFGGTTVLVVPAETPEALTAMLETLEAHDPLQQTSRFHRLRVVPEAELAEAMSDLHTANRRNVLIVPAVFYAGPAVMGRLRASIASARRDMTIAWLPGLGGRLAALPEPADVAPPKKTD